MACCASAARSIAGSTATGACPTRGTACWPSWCCSRNGRCDQIARACDGDRFRPVTLGVGETRLIEALGRDRSLSQGHAARGARQLSGLARALSRARARPRSARARWSAMQDEAGLDLRVNTLKADRDTVYAALQQSRRGGARTTKLSPTRSAAVRARAAGHARSVQERRDRGAGRRLADRRAAWPMPSPACASSISAPAPAARPWRWRRRCRTRAISSRPTVAAKRLERATERLRRAGASIVQRQPLASARDKWVKRHAAGLRSRVRRCALYRHRHVAAQSRCEMAAASPRIVEELPALQADILDSAQRLVKPGGRLIYATCSLLMDERRGSDREIPRRRIRISPSCRSPRCGAR